LFFWYFKNLNQRGQSTLPVINILIVYLSQADTTYILKNKKLFGADKVDPSSGQWNDCEIGLPGGDRTPDPQLRRACVWL
jgi:hypothetical protein